jgi:hypothetical protein
MCDVQRRCELVLPSTADIRLSAEKVSAERHTVESIRVANVSQISATVVRREATFGYYRVLTVLLWAISAGTDNDGH